ncbi:amidophosphoribosyltransferase-like [Pelmatolapia mariae]|uniref:amidophosphoribosyltransferase-like n=1 Tax=Pelmatolapia mariae TaxID=158779 RepID=UPI002FE5B9F1
MENQGQECAGIVTSNGASPPTYTTHKGMGLVSTAFPPEALTKLRYGNLCICHTRYSTTGISELQNCQPFVVDTLHGKIAVAHNGELVNAHALRKKVRRGLCLYYREVLPGEIVQISRHGVTSLSVVPRPEGGLPAFCIFEYVYFARPDSIFEGQMVYTVRQRCGWQLAAESPTDADVVSTVPESATPAALGYAQQSGLPYVEVLCKNRYVGRTFIQPNTRLRQIGVTKKFGALMDNFDGKRVVLIDDSIARGNTISPIIKLLKEAGAKEVHIRVASPPVRFPCYMGINIPTKEELIANKPEFEDIAGYIGADSVRYLTVEGLVSAVQEGIALHNEKDKINHKLNRKVGHCTACLTGKYPVELEW